MSDDVLYPYVEIRATRTGRFSVNVRDTSYTHPAHFFETVTSTLDHVFQQVNRLHHYDMHLVVHMPCPGVLSIGCRALNSTADFIAEGNAVAIYKQLGPHLHMMRGMG